MDGAPAQVRVSYTPGWDDEPALRPPWSGLKFEFLNEDGESLPLSSVHPEVPYSVVYVRADAR